MCYHSDSYSWQTLSSTYPLYYHKPYCFFYPIYPNACIFAIHNYSMLIFDYWQLFQIYDHVLSLFDYLYICFGCFIFRNSIDFCLFVHCSLCSGFRWRLSVWGLVRLLSMMMIFLFYCFSLTPSIIVLISNLHLTMINYLSPIQLY